jgi:hypothetical protein
MGQPECRSFFGQRHARVGQRLYCEWHRNQGRAARWHGDHPNLDSIEEFRVLASNADAEYGDFGGGQVNPVTQSGSDQFHGAAFDFLRNADLDARNFFSPSRGSYIQNQFGGTLGGPITHNKVFFFGDYQGTRLIQGASTGLGP